MNSDDAQNSVSKREAKPAEAKPKMQDKAKIAELEQEIKLIKEQSEETQNKYLRIVADYQNLEKRQEKERLDWSKYANAQLLSRILEVADNLDRAAAYIKDAGLDMVRNNLVSVLKDFGVEEIRVLGQEFNHMTMEAVDKKSGKENHVIEVVQKGYCLHDRVLRPAKVIVGSGTLN